MSPVPLTFPALDGRVLGGVVYAPERDPSAVVVVLPALGVPQSYYGRFAAYLAGTGVVVLTLDYRGVGASADRPLRSDEACLLDWARLDAAAAIDLARERWPDLPVVGVGHSFGGQAFGLTARGQDLDAMVVIAAGAGDFSVYPSGLAWKYRLMLGVAAPVMGAALGYVPGRLGLGSDLPAGVVGQWRQWCFTPDYVRGALGEERTYYHRLAAPLLFLEAPDDVMSPPASAAMLRGWFRRAPTTHRVFAASELPERARGHFGIFRDGGAPVWDAVAAFVRGVRPPATA